MLNLTSQTLPLSPENSQALPKMTYAKPSGLPHLKVTCLETYSKILRELCKSSKRQAPLEAKFDFLHRPSWRVWISFVVCKLGYFPSPLRREPETYQYEGYPQWEWGIFSPCWWGKKIAVCHCLCLAWYLTYNDRLEGTQNAYVSGMKWHRIFWFKWLWPMNRTRTWAITPLSLLVWGSQHFSSSEAPVLPDISRIY